MQGGGNRISAKKGGGAFVVTRREKGLSHNQSSSTSKTLSPRSPRTTGIMLGRHPSCKREFVRREGDPWLNSEN